MAARRTKRRARSRARTGGARRQTSTRTGANARRRPAARTRRGPAAKTRRRRATKARRRPGTSARAHAASPKARPRRTRASAPDAPLAALARRIVAATLGAEADALRDLYAEGAVSREATGHVATGLAELEAKLARWNAMQERSEWSARNVFCDGGTICIEWDATVHARDGRVIPFSEVAIHQVRDGRIVAERFYYDPRVLAPRSVG